MITGAPTAADPPPVVTPPPLVAGFTLKMVDVAPGGTDTAINNLNEAAELLDGAFDPARYNIAFNGQAGAPQPVINHGYKVVTKPWKRFADGGMKANFDIEVAAGNVAGEGAKMALLSIRERAGALALLQEVTYVELSDRADFNDRFVDLLAFPS